jgi:hypothetical protein
MMSKPAPTAVTCKNTYIIEYKVISVPEGFGKA